MKLLGQLVRPLRRSVLAAAAATILATACLLAGPLAVRHGIDRGIRRGDPDALDHAVVAYLAVALVGWAAARAQLRIVARAGEDLLAELRRRAITRTVGRSSAFFDRHPSGDLMARLTSDVDSLQELVQTGLGTVVTNTLLVIVTGVVLVALSPALALGFLAVAPLLVLAIVRFRRSSNHAYAEVRTRIGATTAAVQEDLAGIDVIQSFAREHAAAERFHAVNRAQHVAVKRANDVSARFVAFVDAASTLVVAAVLALAAWLTVHDAVTVGTVTAFVLYLNNFWEPVGQLSQLLGVIQSARAALVRLQALLDEPDELPVVAGPPLARTGDLVADLVAYRYGATAPLVLHDVSLRLEPGERLALIGPTGAGKSTLARLLVRLQDPTSGTVRWGATDLRDADWRSVRDRLVFVPQEGHLFAGTVADNVRLARPSASDEEVAGALAAIGCLAWATALPEGLRTEVHEAGSRLSAGGRQLVALARAALADPSLLVLDEATSSLDGATEHIVATAVDALMEGRTIVIVAHRLTTAVRADRIAVVEGGRLVELGPHAELLAAGGRYSQLHTAWTATGSAP